MRWGRRNYPATAVILLVVALIIAGCGGRGRDGANDAAASGSEAQGEAAVPTMPAAQFAQPTTMIAAETEAAADAEAEAANGETAETEAEAADSDSADTDAAEAAGAELTAIEARGLELYTTRNCGDCHGAAAEGVDGEGPALAGTAMTLDEFTDLLRTGGEIGPDHLFGPMTISPSGVEAVHAWLQSLSAE